MEIFRRKFTDYLRISKINTKFVSNFEDNGFMSRSKEEYSIRTNNYYLERGGIYATLLSVLTKMRKDPKLRGMASPAQVLNDVTYYYDNLRNDNEKNIYDIKNYLYLCVYASLLLENYGKDSKDFVDIYNNLLTNDKKYFPYFNYVWNINKKTKDLYSQQSSFDQQRIIDLEDDINALRSQLDETNEKNAKLQKVIEELKIVNQSKSDKALTFNGILDYISQHKQYQFVAPIINMLKDITHSVITEEQYQRLVEVEKKIMEESYVQEVHNHNTISGSNVFPGNVNNPSFPINK